MELDKKIKDKFDKTLKEQGIFDLTGKLQKKFNKAEFYLVGGSVRDIIIGRQIKDIDLLIRKVKVKDLECELKKTGKVNLVGERFSVLKFGLTPPNPPLVRGGNKAEIDIAIPRKDFAFGTGRYKDFRIKSDPNLPVKDDLSRRDFTVNSMAWNIMDKKLEDPFGGFDDLKKKIIRAVGDPKERFREDYSRMLRAIRFAMQLGFTIDKKTWEAVKQNIGHINDKVKEERKVSYEVIAGEFLKSFNAKPVETIKMYMECGALKLLMPEVLEMKKCSQPKDYHSEGDVLTHTFLALNNLDSKLFKSYFKEPPQLTTKVAILFHDVAKPSTKKKVGKKTVFYNHDKKGAEIAKKIIDRLKLTSPPDVGIDGEEVVWLIKNHLLFMHSAPEKMKKTTIERYLFNDRFSGIAHMQLFLADASATRPAGKPADLTRFKKAMKIIKEMKPEKAPQLPKSFLDGNEIMKMVNLKPGPKVGEILEALREEQLSGRIKNITEAKKFVKKYPVK
ncbi:HD domain-containing protein [Candidatus Parcubacteria bacterium]|nr:HD domain-containing protein [Candidatus Parcubacteria bacterium]